MTTDTVFTIANTSVLPMWLLMIILPKWKLTRFLVDYRVIPLLLSLVYATYIGLSMQGGTNFDFGSLESVMNLFTEKDAVLAGWVHYLAFDLVGGYVDDSKEPDHWDSSIVDGALFTGNFYVWTNWFFVVFIYTNL